MRVTQFIDDGEMYVQIAHLDITDRKRAGLEVEEKVERLRNFTRILSYNPRNSFSVVVDYVESLLGEMTASDQLERVMGALDQMDDIVTDALVLARHGTVEGLSAVDLETYAATAWEHAETDTTTPVVADSIEFRADSNLLGHALENLFRNSAEYGVSDDDPTVTVGVLDGDATKAGFYVENDNAGTPTKTHDMVFEAGYSTGEKGAGLDLLIAAQAARIHDRDVVVTEAEGGDARFEITSVECPA